MFDDAQPTWSVSALEDLLWSLYGLKVFNDHTVP
jgi:hypothetical protein